MSKWDYDLDRKLDCVVTHLHLSALRLWQCSLMLASPWLFSIVHEVLSHLNGDGKKGFSDTHSGRPNGIP